MAKKPEEKSKKRDVLAALLGDLPAKSNKTLKKIVASASKKSTGPKPGKETKGKGTKTKASTGRREPAASYAPTQKIHVLKDRECRAGTRAEQCWVMLRKSKTVGDYLTARKKAGMEGIGGWFGNFVKSGFVSVR